MNITSMILADGSSSFRVANVNIFELLKHFSLNLF
jgi:hypothetical protein